MDDVFADLRYAFRSLRLAPAFFAMVVCILGLGIGATVSIFSLVDGVLLRPLPYRDPNRLVTLTGYSTKPPFDSNGWLSYADFLQLKATAHAFADMAATFRTGWSLVTLTGGAEPVKAQGAFVTPNLFSMFGRSPILGRTFTADENLHASKVVVIGEGLWRARFGSSPDAVGQFLEIDNARWRVIGVMPGDFKVPFLNVQLWAPILSNPGWKNTENQTPQQRQRWDVMARLKPDVPLRVAQAEIDSIENGLRAALPALHPDSVRVVPLREHFVGNLRKPMWILFGAVSVLLLIACGNVANLFLARAAQREREFAIRGALGASRSRVFRQLLTEGITYSCIAGGIGSAASAALIPVLKTFAPSSTPLIGGVTLNWRSLVFALAVSLCAGILFGLAPAVRQSARRLREFLNAGARGTMESPASRRFKSLLVAFEFALAMLLLTGAGLFLLSFMAVVNEDLGFQSNHVLTVQLGPELSGAKLTQFYRQAMDRISQLPGVTAVGAVGNLFFLDEERTHALRQVEGRPPEPKSLWKPLVWTQVTGNYFQAMGISLLHGRYFNDSDRPETGPVAIVNQTLARRYWPGENPVGKRLKGFDPRGQHDDWVTVVGEVRDTRSGGLEKPPFSEIYEVQAQSREQVGNLVVRTASDPAPLAAAVRRIIHQVNPAATISSIETMQQMLELQTMQRRFETWLIGVFSAMALALAALGIFAVMHYSVVSKTGEIGIRVAVGARSADIVRLFLTNGVRQALAGVVCGAMLAMWSSDLVESMLYQVRPGDPMAFLVSGATLTAVAMLASFGPAVRASRIDPVVALREQ